MNAYGLFGSLLILVSACGPGDPESLEEVDVTRLGLIADFDPELPDAPGLFAALTYGYEGEGCPQLDVSADVDGVPLAASPNGTGSVSGGCQIGFFLVEPAPPAAQESTIRFHDGSAEASLAVARLLEPRFPVASAPQGSLLSAGEQVEFTWPVDTDVIEHLDAVFIRGAEATDAESVLAGDQVTVTVPSLALGDWTLSVGVFAHASVLRCERAAECSVSIFGEAALPVTIE